MISLIVALNTATLTVIGWLVRMIIVYKKESNKWKMKHENRLSKIEQKLSDYIENSKK